MITKEEMVERMRNHEKITADEAVRFVHSQRQVPVAARTGKNNYCCTPYGDVNSQALEDVIHWLVRHILDLEEKLYGNANLPAEERVHPAVSVAPPSAPAAFVAQDAPPSAKGKPRSA